MTYMNVTKGLNRFKRGKRGVTAIEYAMLLALIAGVIIVPVANAGGNLQQIFCKMSGAIGGTACADAAPPISFPATQAFYISGSGFPGAIDLANSSFELGFVVSPLDTSGNPIFQSGPFTSGPATAPQTFATFSPTNAPGSPWGSITDNSTTLAALQAACKSGTSPVGGFATGPASGVPVVTSLSQTSAAELSALGDNPAQYIGPSTPPTFASTDSVITCGP